MGVEPGSGSVNEGLAPGTRIGEFEIVGLLGEGGMGQVYRARQEHPAREVALKLIRASALGRDALKRFELEAQVLGRLQHPGVAQIHHAGFHGPDPYFAMELVEGEPLTAYAHRAQLGMRERLALMAKVCEAVQHAHAKGIVHRDLKPANILVTAEGQPKILDFGVARATDSDIETATLHTEIGQLVGTVPYMSPEQASGDSSAIDTRSDVYALGVVTYELLTGILPYDLSAKMVHEAVRVIREDDPRPLSSVHRAFAGDVDVIVSKALEKEKERRYQSAHELAQDIGRYLADQPIVARPPSAAYQLRKFAHRNRALVSGVAAVFAALVLGLAGTLWQAARAAERARSALDAEQVAREAEARALDEARRAGEAEARALDEAARASAAERAARDEQRTAVLVSDFLSEMFKAIGPEVAQGRDTTLLRGVVDQARESLDRSLLDEPLVRARLLRVLGIVLHDLADYPAAEDLVRRSLEAARAAPRDSELAVARSQFDLGRILESTGRYAESREAFGACLDAHRRAGLGNSHFAIVALSGIGGTYVHERRYEQAAPILAEVLELRRRALAGGQDEYLADAIDRYATALFHTDPQGALELTREALAMRTEVLGEGHPRVAVSLMNLATILSTIEPSEEVFALADEGVARHREVFGPEHPYTANALNSAAAVHERMGLHGEAARLRRESLAILRGRFGPDARPTMDAVWNLGSSLERAGDFAGAEEQYRAMLAWADAHHPPGDNRTSAVSLLVARMLVHQERFAEAEELLSGALEALLVGRPPGHAQIAGAREGLVAVLLAQEKHSAAETLLLAAHAELEAQGGPAARAAATRLVDLYERWAAADPTQDAAELGERAADWRRQADGSTR